MRSCHMNFVRYGTRMAPDHRFWQWFAGQMDGDGTIGLCSKWPVLSLSKAEKGASAVVRVKSEIGGSIHHRPSRGPRRQQSQVWQIGGRAAVEVARKLTPYLRLKRRRAEVLLQWTSPYKAMSISKGGVVRKDLTREEVASIIGAGTCTVSRHLRTGKPLQGWQITKRAGTRQEVYEQLLSLKDQPDGDLVGTLHPSYVAGFFDAEGYVELKRANCPRVTVGQRWPAITAALKAQYGGNVYIETREDGSNYHCWTVYSANARAFLHCIKADVSEKARQVELCLSVTPQNWQTVAAEMKSLRGNQL